MITLLWLWQLCCVASPRTTVMQVTKCFIATPLSPRMSLNCSTPLHVHSIHFGYLNLSGHPHFVSRYLLKPNCISNVETRSSKHLKYLERLYIWLYFFNWGIWFSMTSHKQSVKPKGEIDRSEIRHKCTIANVVRICFLTCTIWCSWHSNAFKLLHLTSHLF